MKVRLSLLLLVEVSYLLLYFYLIFLNIEIYHRHCDRLGRPRFVTDTVHKRMKHKVNLMRCIKLYWCSPIDSIIQFTLI